jgi:predicted RNase H-like HicB family nuclease
MIQEYLNKAMETAHYEILEGNEGFYGSIPDAPGVWATGETLEACRRELLEVLEEWILLGVKLDHALPEFAGVSLTINLVAS